MFEGTWVNAAHLKLVNDRLLALTRGDIFRLMISIPPGHGKSTLVDLFYAAWILGNHPDSRVMLVSHSEKFASEWGLKVRRVMERYGPELFGLELDPESRAKDLWHIKGHPGQMVSVGVGGPITGRRVEFLLIDDPVPNAEAAYSLVQRDNVYDWLMTTALTRLEPDGKVVLVMTRWHEDDVVGRILRNAESGGPKWEYLKLPALAETDDPLGRRAGEALCPERWDEQALAAIKAELASSVFSAMYQQNPIDRERSIFHEDWFEERYGDLPEDPTVVVAVDAAFKEGVQNSYSVIAVWAGDGRYFYLLDVWRRRVGFPDLIRAVQDVYIEAAGARLQECDRTCRRRRLRSILDPDAAQGFEYACNSL